MMANSNYSEFLYYGLQYVVLEEDAYISNFWNKWDCSLSEKKESYQIFINFLYRCLKCDILKDFDDDFRYSLVGKLGIDEYIKYMASLPLSIEEAKIYFDKSYCNEDIERNWDMLVKRDLMMRFLFPTDKLINFAKESGLNDYMDEDGSEFASFIDMVNQTFDKEGIPWDPDATSLFPVVHYLVNESA